MVTNSIVCYTSALLLMFQSVYGVELTFDLPDSARDCFHEEIDKNTSVVLEYQVVTGGQYDVDVVLEGPNQEILYQQTRSQFDSHQFTTTTKGVYTVCFSNEFSTFSHKIIYMDFQVGDENPLTPDIDEHATALTQLESSAQEIHKSLNAILDYQTHHRLREAQGRKRAEELNERVLWWSIAEAFAILAISITQVLVLRNFFTDRTPHQQRYGRL